MNAWQFARQLKFLLGARRWLGDSANEKVFGAVHVTAGVTERGVSELRYPFALIRIGRSSPDEEAPDLRKQSIEVTLVQQVEGDAIGERALIGANRSGSGVSSKGRGLLEVEEELFEVVRLMHQLNGVHIISWENGDIEVSELLESAYIASRAYEIMVYCTDKRFYPPCQNFSATSSPPNISLSWENPPSRYDLKKVVLRRAVGGTPPASPTDGDGIILASDLATSATDSPPAGTYSYSLFAGYADWDSTVAQNFSEPVSVTNITV